MAYDHDGKITTGTNINVQASASSYMTNTNFPNFPTEVLRDQRLNECYTSTRQYHFNGPCTSFSPPAQHHQRPLIASFDHPLRKRVREIQSFDLENLLGYGPRWISKDYLRSLCSASKPWTSRDQLMRLRNYIPVTSHSRTHLELSGNQSFTQLESQFRRTNAPVLPKVTNMMCSYNPGNTVRSKLVMDPSCHVSRSITKIPNYSTPCITKYPKRDLDNVNPQETRNEDDVLGNYCRWFDNLSSAILESNIGGESELHLAGAGETHNGSYHQAGSLPKRELYTEETRLDLGKRKSERFQDKREISKLAKNELNLIPLNCSNGDEKKADKKDRHPDLEKDNLVQPSQTMSRENKAGIKLKHGISERLGEEKDALYADKLVCIVQNYMNSDDFQRKKHNVKQQEDEDPKYVKENTINKQKEQKRRKRIEVLRKLMAQQENKLAKLKRQANRDLDDGQSSDETSSGKNKVRRQEEPKDAVCQSGENGATAAEKSISQTKIILKKRWLSDWTFSTADPCANKTSSI